jgi:HSP20 family protein
MNERKYFIPPADIFETKDKYILTLDMPGCIKEGIDIDCEGDELSITGRVKETNKDWNPVSIEYRVLDYRRIFTISTHINREAIQAKYEDGILTIELEKSESVKPRKIEVKAA